MTDPSLLNVEQLRAALSAGVVDPTDVVAAMAQRSRAVDAQTNCFVALDETAALKQAASLNAQRASGRPAGLLWGVPYVHKDVFVTSSRHPAAGSLFSELPVAFGSGSALTALDSADAIALGATTLDECSYGATGLNDHHGDCRNPWDDRFITGGSSSGAAAAVAARAVPFAIGSDTAGSTRIPAALCGVVGFKPTFGRLRTSGMVPLSPSQDTVGVIARTVRDCALVTDALDRHASPRLRSSRALIEGIDGSVNNLKIGICCHPFFTMQDAETGAVISQALRVIERLGVNLKEQFLSGLEDCDAAAAVITWMEVREAYAGLLRTAPQKFSPSTRLRLEMAMAPTAEDYRLAQAYRAGALRAFFDSAFADVDVLVAPTVTLATPMIALLSTDPKESVKTTTAFLRSNRCISYLGLPALSVPVGFTSQGLPVGLQFIGKPWAELAVLRCGAAYQAATDWHMQLPPSSNNS
ncbi:amidase [Glaciimonas sp. PCH181]|uniref:amidase n=1 Tax=Glaciimonas sp. PCH181 TaxID=2133943 RepID=UPI000D3C2100|nr:amidase [Glaciimonas sp. PCH181]PUA17710.1 hypothetical protein C7W93_17730 [Glaciimonas sp. PCH181]